MSAKATYILLIFILFATSCSPQTEPIVRESINWKNLQITPKPVDDLCAKIPPEKLDTTGEDIKHSFSNGLAQALFPKDISTPHKIAGGTYWVNANDQLPINWLFWYPKGNEGPLNLRVFVLLDEQQLTNALPQPGSYNDLHLEQGDEITTIPISLPSLTAGVHTIIAIAILSPQKYPNEYGTVEIVSSRMALIVEPATSPFRAIDFVSLPAEGSIKKDDPGMVIVATLTRKEDRKNGILIWNWPDPWLTVNADTRPRFYTLAGYEDVNNLDAPSLEPLEESFFAILLFIDYQQVEITPNQTVLYGVVDKDNAYTRIPIELPPLSEGKHHILALRIDTPGVPYCILKGNTKERILPSFIYGTLVGIKVLPSK